MKKAPVENDFSNLTKEEAISLLNETVPGQDRIVMNPKLLARMIELGVEFKIEEGESIDQFFDKARNHAHELISHLPPMPNWLEYQFRRAYYEARCNLLMGLNGASITLSAILLESILKWTAFCVESKDATELPKDRWQFVEEKMQFGDAIGYAKRWGLVDKELSVKLHQFREDIRNVQTHALTMKATSEMEFQKVTVLDVTKKSVSAEQVISAVAHPTFSALAKEKLDESRALHVFTFMHSVMEHLFSKMVDSTAEIVESKGNK